MDFSDKATTIFPKDKPPMENLSWKSTVLLTGEVINNHFVVNTNMNKLSLNFFSEEGSLVAGLRTKVTFKATGKDGTGKVFQDTIEDEKGTQVVIFETSHAGMGVLP